MRLGALPVLVLGNHSSPNTELGLQVVTVQVSDTVQILVEHGEVPA